MYEYAYVHVFFTIPLAILLTVILGPLFTRLDVYKIGFLVVVAFTYTLPWDSYLVRQKIWTYPTEAVFGLTLLDVPVEELFFFVIQTYITSCLFILFNKPVLTAVYLRNESADYGPDMPSYWPWKQLGQIFFAACIWISSQKDLGREATYMKLIVVWVSPIFLMLWTLSYQTIIGLPLSKTFLPIAIPTLFLWFVDTFALHRGTWSIELGTKLGINLWPHLDLEEALFFLVTNSMIGFGAAAFDTAVAILDAFPDQFPVVSGTPSPILLLKALFVPCSKYDHDRLAGLRNALAVLAKKSRSFYLASGVFTGRLRIDLVLLYGFCRVADDLIDDAPDAAEAREWIQRFTDFLDAKYVEKQDDARLAKALDAFPPGARSILKLLPTEKLPSKPLYELLEGFKMDLKFLDGKAEDNPPIETKQDLERYANCVAATIGELCLNLVYYHNPDRDSTSDAKKTEVLEAGSRMGRALQYINIARDVTTDADAGRCYIPRQWFSKAAASTPAEFRDEVLELRSRILSQAFDEYRHTRDAIEELPAYARDGIRVAVESYLEIGRELRRRIEKGQPLDLAGGGKSGRASVPRSRRVLVGWMAMAGWRGAM